MKQRKAPLLLAVLLMLSVANYFRISGHENIRNIQFLSIFVIGMLSGLLTRELVMQLKAKR
ncbi:MAG: hypothetical protein WAT19_02220 [Ferruginibacter sp.]